MDNVKKRELANSAAKTLFSIIPYVGGLLNEVIYDYRGRVKQERINRFVLLLAEYFGDNNVQDQNIFTTEDFGDLFESVLKRVALTKSQEKHIRFRDILINYITSPYPDADDTEIFLDLVNYLSETGIIILKHHQIFNAEFFVKQDEYNSLNEEVIRLQSDINFINNGSNATLTQNDLSVKMNRLKQFEEEFSKLNEVKLAKFYGISEDSFLYYKQILFARGLLSDKGIGAINSTPFLNMAITEFGKKFISFIINDRIQ